MWALMSSASIERLSGRLDTIRVSAEVLLLLATMVYYDDYLLDSRCDDKSDLFARSSTIEMRGELSP